MLTEKQIEDLHVLNDLRKQVELLDSHMKVGFISEKQYAETMNNIVRKVEKLEEENGIKPEPIEAFNFMFKDGIEKFEQMMEGIFK